MGAGVNSVECSPCGGAGRWCVPPRRVGCVEEGGCGDVWVCGIRPLCRCVLCRGPSQFLHERVS